MSYRQLGLSIQSSPNYDNDDLSKFQAQPLTLGRDVLRTKFDHIDMFIF